MAPDGASGAAAEQVTREITQPESSPSIAANAGAQAKLTFVGVAGTAVVGQLETYAAAVEQPLYPESGH